MPERVVLCGGLPAERCAGEILEIDVNGPKGAPNRVNLHLGDICARMVRDIPPVLADLLEIAAYVYCADQFTRRGGDTMAEMGKDWRRRFRFRIPVRQADIWNRDDVREALVETVGFLSEDDYAFDFVAQEIPTILQPYLDLDCCAEHTGFVPDEVMLFSGGLDSFAGAVESLIGRGLKVALVSHHGSTMVRSKQSHLVQALQERTCPAQLFHVPVTVNKGNQEAAEFTQRTRSFMFATLALVVARLFRRDTIHFYENGIVSVNLPVAGHVLGARATRTTHPQVLAGFSRLFSLVLDMPITVANPYFWKTKSDVVSVLGSNGCADLIRDTFSCTRVREATKRGLHCGVCSQCLDRRFGILGAGLRPYEPEDVYAVDLFRGERKPGPAVVMAESYVLHALKLAGMSSQTFFSSFGQIYRVLPYLDGSMEENAMRLHDLHRRHGQTVEQVITRELAEHATVTRMLSLPETSLLTLIQSQSVRLPTVDVMEMEPPAAQQAAGGKRKTLERPLIFAIDRERQKVNFRGGIQIGGAGYGVLEALAREFSEDVGSGLSRNDFRFVKPDVLATRLNLDGQGLRQRITRLRKKLERAFLKVFDVQLAEDDIIQNQSGKGYRLSPYLLLVQLSQVDERSAA